MVRRLRLYLRFSKVLPAWELSGSPLARLPAPKLISTKSQQFNEGEGRKPDKSVPTTAAETQQDQIASASQNASSVEQQIRSSFSAVKSRLAGAVDELAELGRWKETAQQAADRAAVEAVAAARKRAAESGRSHLLTADQPGFEGLFTESLRNSRVPVAAVSPADSWDWSGPWNWKQWVLWSLTPLTAFALYWIFFIEWYRWRYGYYHIHQAAENLQLDDVEAAWTAVDHVANMVQRPHWRRRAAESGVVDALVPLVTPSILDIRPPGLAEDVPPQLAGYNLLLQVLLAINWIMFDEVAEQLLRQTDLRERLRESVDGPDHWIRLALPRAVARNLLFKLDNPPLRPYLGTGLQRIRGELQEFMAAFPNLPERHSSAAHASGLRGDDPMMGWRGQKIMDANSDVLATPGLQRRIARWRSWWNKHEVYPPSVDRWLRQREDFFRREHELAQETLRELKLSACMDNAAASLKRGSAAELGLHLQRGFVLAFCGPLRRLNS